mmetsp:Transcript_12856/g.28002  ORF Transcript_12856/g.28002 Transcript_12856/m.28002 type:complete len:368 (-) Transcript_12856:1581-2684(-)
MAYNEDSSASGHDEPWIQWFCGLKGHEMFCQVERSYIEDSFNLYGLRACVSNFSDCLDLILDRIGPEDSDDSHLTQSACTLYGLIHARYIVTTHGLDSMYNKYAAKEFGTCPLVQCTGQPVLPVGLRDDIGVDTAKIFCPKCKCVYQPPPFRTRSGHSNNGGGGAVDGAAIGTTFPHLFLMTFNNLVPDPLPPNSTYVPRVFGFRVHSSAHRPGGGSNLSFSNSRRSGSQRAMTSSRAVARNSGNVNSSNNAAAAPASVPSKSEDKAVAKSPQTTTSGTTTKPAPKSEKGEPIPAAEGVAAKEVKEEGTVKEETALPDEDGAVAPAPLKPSNDGPFISKKRPSSNGDGSSKSRVKRVKRAELATQAT